MMFMSVLLMLNTWLGIGFAAGVKFRLQYRHRQRMSRCIPKHQKWCTKIRMKEYLLQVMSIYTDD